MLNSMMLENFMDGIGVLVDKMIPLPKPVLNPFKKENTFLQRRTISENLMNKYSDVFPAVIVSNDFALRRIKYLVRREHTLSKFIRLVREQCMVERATTVFCLINDRLFPGSENMGSIYDSQRDEDGFLYINLSREATFG